MSILRHVVALMPKPPTYAFQATTFDATAQTTYTFAGQAIGAASATRYVIAAVTLVSSFSRTISSVTIGGVAATVIPNGQVVANTYFYRTAFYIAAVPTGTTASIVVTASGACNGGGLAGVWAVYNLLSPTAVDSDGATVLGTNTFSPPAVTTSAHGLLLAAGFHATAADPATNSWTNATERSDLSSSFAGIRVGHSAADAITTGAGVTVSDALGGAVDGGSMVVATFR